MEHTATPTGKLTAEEFFAWSQDLPDGEQYELVDGEVLRMQAENYRHAVTKRNITRHLQDALRTSGRGDCQSLPDGFGVRVSDDQVREPDAQINCGPMSGSDVYARAPVVVVEVVSPSTRRVDMTRKLIDYLRVPSIHHYLIVLADDRRVLLHSRSREADEIRTRILGEDSTIDLDPPGITLAISDFFVDLPADD